MVGYSATINCFPYGPWLTRSVAAFIFCPENLPSDTSNGAPLCGVTYPQLGSQCDYTLIDYHASQQI